MAGCSGAADNDVNSPVLATETLADPHVIRHDGKYYLYGTAAEADHYDVFTSIDGLSWDKENTVFRKQTDTLWAPDVFHDPQSDLFYLYYSMDFSIGVAVAKSPTGPFEDRGIIIDDAIDAHMFYDEGRYYLYYATASEGFTSLEEMGERLLTGVLSSLFGDDKRIRKRIYVQPMTSPTSPSGEPRFLIEASDDWEKGYTLHVVEAPWVLKRGDTYYLMYSGSPTHESQYAVGYASSDNPLGVFSKSTENPILHTASDPAVFGRKVHGPGHHSVVQGSDGTHWIYFHQNASRFNIGMGGRYTARGRLIFDEDGGLSVRLDDVTADQLQSNNSI